ncbi:MAG: [LysW]-aminoadipate kinase [Anaerolineales bacterium]|nr:[LysW]-aminoadipate kinase [Anaerolineales bacterium]MCX7609790.1 [LysW]-aminoadipate kinase [Anaerolineales bacterium]MDW8227959.1 [LysW]-aminoadipate kinase [Anaerolineales bacterium]
MNPTPLLVVKAGGTEGVNFSAICEDAAALLRAGQRMVLVHGGSAEANALGEALDVPPRFITSPSGYTSRYTNRETLEIFLMAVNGKVNSLLVEQFQKLGVNAFGLSGLDGRVLLATRKEAIQSIEHGKRKIIRDDYTGKIEKVNVALLQTLLHLDYLPVLAPVAVSEKGEALNVDADRAAAMIAAALQAETLILLTAAPGLMERFPDESTVLPRLPRARLPEALEMAQGRMKKKILGAEEALNGGVRRVIIADGRLPQPITQALAGRGTIIA